MSEDSLQASFWTMIVIQTIGSIDMPGRGERKLPAPHQYVAILVTWLVLQLISAINSGAQKAAAAIGWALVLTGLVVGPFGKQVINLFSIIRTQFSSSSSVETASVQAASNLSGTPTSQVSSLTPFPATGTVR